MQQPIQVVLQVVAVPAAGEQGALEAERLVDAVWTDVLEEKLGVPRRVYADDPAGSKGVVSTLAGWLLISLSAADQLAALVELVRRRLLPGRRRVLLTIGDRTIEITGATPAQVDRALDLFEDAVSGEPTRRDAG